MAAVNQAWQVLGHPQRRAEYDLSLRTPTASAASSASSSSSGGSSRTASAPSAEPAFNPLARYQNPPKFPWRFMGVMAGLGVLVVMLGVLTMGDPPPPTVDNVLHAGDCVVIEPNGDAAERLCTEPHDGTVEVFLAGEGLCPDGTEIHRDRQGLGQACIRLLSPGG